MVPTTQVWGSPTVARAAPFPGSPMPPRSTEPPTARPNAFGEAELRTDCPAGKRVLPVRVAMNATRTAKTRRLLLSTSQRLVALLQRKVLFRYRLVLITLTVTDINIC